MPKARYSAAAVRPNCSTNAGSNVAAIPSDDGHTEMRPPAAALYSARVRTVIGRNAFAQAFAVGLELVVPLRGNGRCLHRRNEHVPQVIFFQEFLLLIGQVAGIGFPFDERLAFIRAREIAVGSRRN